jgi:ABC-type branched-subunit amino acid transport system substrate-binding protein/DNA-binding beta-propeller fold protein YncE
MTVAPGSTFAGYRVECMVGRGGMGVVYRATDLSLDRPVALKLIAPELAQDERFRARLMKEPRLAASLDHPNVIPIYEAGEYDGRWYVAMRFVAGDDLRALLRRERTLDPERALGLLGQIAGALDAAHRRGLVHRDVKPANVLIDEDDHAYLTDFGITKRLGAASAHTGELVGTLDYLAPEQIRGEAVDGRSDSYALACVLYECLAGVAPFRRETEAETMWAHLQGEPPPLPRRPALDGVLRRALAKEREDRYASCRELIDDARRALGLPPMALAAETRRRRPIASRMAAAGLVRRRAAILAAGVVLLGAAMIAALVVVIAGGDGKPSAPVGNGVAAIGPDGDRVGSFIDFGTAPSNVAVGEGAVWVLSSEDRTLSRIDPATKAVTARLSTRGIATDIAAGAGAVWIGNGGGPYGGNITVSISRMDPRTGRVTHTAKLPNGTAGSYSAPFNWGFANIAIGAGAVWAKDPDNTIARIDPRTGRVVATIPVEAHGIAAGREGVWILRGSDVVRIDPRTNRLGQSITLGTPAPTAIAVGGGKVWVSAEQEGVVWRVDPGPSPLTRTIDVGAGVSYIAYGAGSVWAANFVNGTVSRIDPRTNRVTGRIPVGGAQALAAGAGSAWISSAGGAQSGVLPDSACGEMLSGGNQDPDVLIASDLPLTGPFGAGPRAMTDAIRSVLQEHRYQAGRFTVGYRSCDDSTAQTGAFENRRCAANANAYARADKLVAVIGPYNSDCAATSIPILNRAPGGPLAIIGPTTTYVGLTRHGGLPPPDGYRNEPDVYYPTGQRNFVRLMPGDDLLAVGQAVLAKQLRLGGVYVVDDGSDFWRVFLSEPFRRSAKRLGVRVAGSARFDPQAPSQTALVDQIARSGADGVVIGGDPFHGADRLVRALRARFGQGMKIMGGFFFGPIPDLLKVVGKAAHGIYVASNDLPRGARPLTAAGRRFAATMGDPARQNLGVVEAGQATELVLAAIARSDGTRASVLRELRASKVKDGILGTFAFDRNGDMTTASVPIIRITGTTPADVDLGSGARGAVLDRVVEVPAELVR